ncbi:MAG: hypothetical protein Q7R97_01635, partial [Candidatus Daviesbacteria bacterium]|nr:hypothetical protein [Candidatus Daviesbacteria bacterium]
MAPVAERVEINGLQLHSIIRLDLNRPEKLDIRSFDRDVKGICIPDEGQCCLKYIVSEDHKITIFDAAIQHKVAYEKLLAIGMISEYLQSAGLIHVSFYRTEAIEPFRRISGDSSTLWKILP